MLNYCSSGRQLTMSIVSNSWTTPQRVLHSFTRCRLGCKRCQAPLPLSCRAAAICGHKPPLAVCCTHSHSHRPRQWFATCHQKWQSRDASGLHVQLHVVVCVTVTFQFCQLKIWPGRCDRPLTLMVSSSRLKYLLTMSGLLAAALAYDKGSACLSLISGCLAQKESHHPLVISMFGSWVVAVRWAIASTSLQDFAYPTEAQPMR